MAGLSGMVSPELRGGFEYLQALTTATHYKAIISALLGIPDTYDDGQGDTLSALDLGLCDAGDMDIGLGFWPIVYGVLQF